MIKEHRRQLIKTLMAAPLALTGFTGLVAQRHTLVARVKYDEIVTPDNFAKLSQALIGVDEVNTLIHNFFKSKKILSRKVSFDGTVAQIETVFASERALDQWRGQFRERAILNPSELRRRTVFSIRKNSWIDDCFASLT